MSAKQTIYESEKLVISLKAQCPKFRDQITINWPRNCLKKNFKHGQDKISLNTFVSCNIIKTHSKENNYGLTEIALNIWVSKTNKHMESSIDL
jgi:hypothetical protein